MSARWKACVTSGVRSMRWLAAIAMRRRIRSLLPGHSVVTIAEVKRNRGASVDRKNRANSALHPNLPSEAPGIFPADGQDPTMMVVTEDPSLLLGVIV